MLLFICIYPVISLRQIRAQKSVHYHCGGKNVIFGSYIYRIGIKEMNYGLSTAVGLFNSIIGSIMLIGSNAILKKTTETIESQPLKNSFEKAMTAAMELNKSELGKQ